MRFILMGMATKELEAAPPPPPEAFAAMQEYNEKLAKAGILLAAEGLSPTSKGARVKFSGDERTATPNAALLLISSRNDLRLHDKHHLIGCVGRTTRLKIERPAYRRRSLGPGAGYDRNIEH